MNHVVLCIVDICWKIALWSCVCPCNFTIHLYINITDIVFYILLNVYRNYNKISTTHISYQCHYKVIFIIRSLQAKNYILLYKQITWSGSVCTNTWACPGRYIGNTLSHFRLGFCIIVMYDLWLLLLCWCFLCWFAYLEYDFFYVALISPHFTLV
jgi:hypothetical protein